MATGENIKTYNNSDNRRRRRRFFDDYNSTNYIKEFENFEDGYNEMISILPSVKIYGGDLANYDIVVKKLLDIIGENIPSPANPNFPNTLALTIKQNEVSFRTDDRIAFGWKIFFNKESGKHIYQMRVTFLSISMSTRKYADAFVESNWVLKEEFEKERFQRSNSNHNKRPVEAEHKVEHKEDKHEQQQEPEKVYEEVAKTTVNTVKEEAAPAKDNKRYWINRGNVAGVYIITYEGRTFVVNINDAAQPAGVVVDKNNNIIRVGNIVYDYNKLNYFMDEGTSNFQEKEEEDNDEFVMSNGQTINTEN